MDTENNRLIKWGFALGLFLVMIAKMMG